MGRQKRKSTTITKTFADRLSDLVEEKKATGLSHNGICEQAGVGSGAMSDWLSDTKTANIDSLRKLAKYFDVSADWLLGLSEARSTDIDVQKICKKTGLSEGIVNYLTRHIEDQSMRSPIKEFNKIFLPERLHGLLFQLSILAENRNKLKNLLEKANDEDFDDITSAYSYLRLFRYEIIESFSKMVDDYIESNEIAKRMNMYFDGEE